MLSARALVKCYGGCAAVRGASLEIEAGDFISIVGRSGSGKSTLLAMLGALTRPDSGELLLGGADIWAMPERRRADFRGRHTGFVFQFPSLLPNLTALDNTALPAFLGHTMPAEAAYARATDLLARVGLGDRTLAYPGTMSGGEERRVAIARALVNSPRLLFADEPTGDLDQDTEAEIIELLHRLQRGEGFGLVLVTHNLDLAREARRIYEMRDGMLAAVALPQTTAAAHPQRLFGPPAPKTRSQAGRLDAAMIPLGRDLWAGVQRVLVAGAVVLGLVLVGDFTVGRYEAARLRERSAQAAALAEMALDSLRGEVASVADLGDRHYELAISLRNVDGGRPIYVMSPDMRAYVQVANEWRELPIAPEGSAGANVRKIEGSEIYRYRFAAQVAGFAQLLPNYMHVRFADTMLVSPSRMPQGDVFERRDNYYVYLKPSDIADDAILKRMRFPGKPPVWIPMPPH
ncbi:MAG TPA: ABC transporter ATP-binding protein [Stellaceae bacterium]|jgi:putative ABC transport system ATP-binding protein/macrolide transport system ATP-binding/permease protein/lipoprotein-releasing system ATP-binding protein